MHAKQVLIYLPCWATNLLNEMIDNVLIIKVLLLNGFWSLRTNLGRKPYYGGRCSPGLIESETGALMWSTPIPHGWTQSHQTMKERTEPADSSPQTSLTENCTEKPNTGAQFCCQAYWNEMAFEFGSMTHHHLLLCTNNTNKTISPTRLIMHNTMQKSNYQ